MRWQGYTHTSTRYALRATATRQSRLQPWKVEYFYHPCDSLPDIPEGQESDYLNDEKMKRIWVFESRSAWEVRCTMHTISFSYSVDGVVIIASWNCGSKGCPTAITRWTPKSCMQWVMYTVSRFIFDHSHATHWYLQYFLKLLKHFIVSCRDRFVIFWFQFPKDCLCAEVVISYR